MPTGNLECPDGAKKAKRVKYAIGDRTKVGGGEDTYDLEARVFEVEGGLPVRAADDAHIVYIGGARTAMEDREDMDADHVPPSNVSTCSQRQVSPTRPRRATTSLLTELIDIMKM